ncbi:MAG: hypothetical protein ACOYIQ_04440 [Christensenellales bacterium]|jgi:hypothetical protein
MSMPIIPDIKPRIELTICDSINLLIASIAQQECAVAKLIDAEAKKLYCAIGKCTNRSELLQINESIRDTVSELVNLEILLKSKLSDAKKLLECCPDKCPKPKCADCAPPCGCRSSCYSFNNRYC